jgi:hypothetical protein
MKEYDLNIPFSLAGITLGQYQDYLKVLDKWDKEDETYLSIKILQIFCGLSPEFATSIPLHAFESTIAHVTGLFNEETPLERKFKLTGLNSVGDENTVEFGFIPKLDDISFGEYIDLETYLGDWQEMHKAMAVLFRPIYHSKREYYLIDKYEGSDKFAQVMKDMPLSVALGATVFFYRLGIKLQKYTLDSLEKDILQGEKTNPLYKQVSEENGDGFKAYIHLHKEMLEGLMILQKPLFISA